jgi:uncharacterized membrane protein
LSQLFGKFGAVRESFWFLPALMTVVAVLLSLITVELDDQLKWNGLGTGPFGNVASADGARTLLATIAGSMITVASLTFSITIASLSLASSQFGPRLIRNFIRDTGNQVVLGTFIATFAYCLMVLRTVRGTEAITFVPSISMIVAVVLAMTSLAVLIYFINHISMSIQATRIIATIGQDLSWIIDRLYPEVRDGEEDEPGYREEQDWRPRGESRRVYSLRSGYIQGVNYRRLVEAAREPDLVINVPHHAGQFVSKGATIAEVFSDGAPVEDEGLDDEIVGAFSVGSDRVAGRDIEFFIDQLVEIAVRALSPGINDPFTAMACIDQLGASLRQLSERKLPSPNHRDDAGEVRVHAESQTYSGAVGAAFNLIRQYGQTSAPVSMRLMETIAVLAEFAPAPEHRETLLMHARMLRTAATSQMRERVDIQALQERFDSVIEALEADSSG